MSQTKRRILFRPASVLLLGALAILLAQSAAYSEQTTSGPLTIVPGTGATHEQIGDPGGTSFGNLNGSVEGKGLPTALGGWPTPTIPFTQDPSFPGTGIDGFSNLGGSVTVNLGGSTPVPVDFTFFGKGDSTFTNAFQVNGQTLFDPNSYQQGLTKTLELSPGPINFSWGTPQGVTVSNGSSSVSGNPGFFAGVGPYTTGLTDTTGLIQPSLASGVGTVFVGLTDRILPPGTESDHDFQDLTVRISAPVPEPASLLMGSTAAVIGLGCAWSRRKRASA